MYFTKELYDVFIYLFIYYYFFVIVSIQFSVKCHSNFKKKTPWENMETKDKLKVVQTHMMVNE